ncbi:VOC family protein [Novosphingobium sp. BL-52-GroH]|uniref:VOC family protein n=1 Tax=Novosphingobium sp. BL-52-GroH TaxID=3349877 RepID=UPI00384ABC53
MIGSAGPFGRFFQIGYVTHDIASGLAILEGTMGARRIDLLEDFRDANGDPVMIRALSHLSMGDAEIELIEPRADWPSVYLDALPADDRTIALHHIGYRQPDVAAWTAARDRAQAAGLAISMEGYTPHAHFAYIDTRATLGHYTEVVYREDRPH